VFPLSVSTSFSLSAFHSLLSLPPPAGYQVRGGWECVCESARIFFLFPSLCLSFTHTHSPSLSLSLCLSPPFSLCTHAHHTLSLALFFSHTQARQKVRCMGVKILSPTHINTDGNTQGSLLARRKMCDMASADLGATLDTANVLGLCVGAGEASRAYWHCPAPLHLFLTAL